MSDSTGHEPPTDPKSDPPLDLSNTAPAPARPVDTGAQEEAAQERVENGGYN